MQRLKRPRPGSDAALQRGAKFQRRKGYGIFQDCGSEGPNEEVRLLWTAKGNVDVPIM